MAKGDLYWYYDEMHGEFLVRDEGTVKKGKHKGKIRVKFVNRRGTRYVDQDELRAIKEN